jgi:cytochrome c553
MSGVRIGRVVLAACLLLTVSSYEGYADPADANSAGEHATAGSTTIDFERDIQPILKSSCYECHGPGKQKSKLRLDSRPLAMRGGRHGKVIMPGDAEQSVLLARVTSSSDNERMPQDRDPLPAGQVELLRHWIEQGAKWPDRDANLGATLRRYWAFVNPVRPELPPVKDAAWARNPIDRFVLSRLESQGLSPAPRASREALIRRASLDLIGLPPSPTEIDAFVNDPSTNAWEKVVDRLLASPRYGERWARHWLDLARYAESEGFKSDETRPYAWRYRDYVIKSFNADKPYDRFVREQIAGDELWPSDPDALVATGFIRHYPDESNARNLMQRRQEILNDITDTVSAVFTGLTVACARCHNHKYDDIPQADYYRLQAFFANIKAVDARVLASPEQVAEYDRKRVAWEETTKSIRDEMARLEAAPRKAIIKEYVDKYPPEIQAILARPASQRSAMDWQMYCKAMLYLSPDSPQYLAPASACAARLKGDAKRRWDDLDKQLRAFDSSKPADLPRGTGIADVGREAPQSFLLKRGAYEAYGLEVEPGFLSAITTDEPTITPPANVQSTGRRTALANWLASPGNPLTARVMVNRIWQHHFGEGIVRTPSDFGSQGDPPTHPELLDWLATEFVRGGWSMKHIHRLIMTSATYQQSCVASADAIRRDSDDRLLSRFPRQRLEGEVIRDQSLAAAGLLNLKMGGPSVFPDIPAGIDGHGWHASSDPAERDRRSIYIFVKRNLRYPMFETFDMPDTVETCARRYNTTTPAQALTLLNDPLTLSWARAFAGRVLNAEPEDQEAQVDLAYRLAYGRHPSSSERQMVQTFLDHEQQLLAARAARREPVVKPDKLPADVAPAQAAAMVDFCHVLMNSNEFLYGS